MARLRVLIGGLAGMVLVSVVLAGCSLGAYQSELSQSLATWQQLKADNGGYYRYETSFGSWAGFGDKTTLTVQNEMVIARAYEAYQSDGNTGETETTESWTEEGAEVGSHEAGADPVTIDALYSRCQNEILTQNTLANDIYLEFRDDGMLYYCQYAPKSCVDDCSTGVIIDRLEFLPQTN